MSYLSRAYYTGDGTTTQFAVPFAYLAQAHVSVQVNGVSRAFTWVNANLVTVTPAPAAGTSVAIIRTTPGAAPQASFNDSNSIPAASLNRNFLQALYVSQEALDVGENGAPLAEASAAQAASSAAAAQSQASAAAASATTAQSQASAAAASATAASASAASAATALDSFDDRYLGAKASDPTVDNDGAPLVTGALYYRTTSPAGMRVWDGAAWLAASAFQQYVIRSGDTMTGPLVLSGDAGGNLQAVPRQQLDTVVGFKNRLVNPGGLVNQRVYVSGTPTTVANQVTVDRWRVVTLGQNLSWTNSAGVRTFTAPAGGVEQLIQPEDIPAGTHCVSWVGTATATINGTPIANGGTFVADGTSVYTLRFSSGTWSLPQVEPGTRRTAFEHRHAAIELLLCQRDCEKSYDTGVAPGSATGTSGSIEDFVVVGAGPARVRFAVSKRTAPVVTVYDVNGVPSTISTFTGAQNNSQTPGAVDNIGNSGFKVFHIQSGLTRVYFHWMATTGI